MVHIWDNREPLFWRQDCVSIRTDSILRKYLLSLRPRIIIKNDDQVRDAFVCEVGRFWEIFERVLDPPRGNWKHTLGKHVSSIYQNHRHVDLGDSINNSTKIIWSPFGSSLGIFSAEFSNPRTKNIKINLILVNARLGSDRWKSISREIAHLINFTDFFVALLLSCILSITRNYSRVKIQGNY